MQKQAPVDDGQYFGRCLMTTAVTYENKQNLCKHTN